MRMTEDRERAREVPGVTWKKRDDALFGVLLPSLDWELVKKLHLEKKKKKRKYFKTNINTTTIQNEHIQKHTASSVLIDFKL